MSEPLKLCLCPTKEDDLNFVLTLEGHPDNRDFIKQWPYEAHLDVINRSDREHWIIKCASSGKRFGYLIAYDLISENCGVYLKRIAITSKSKGVGRVAVNLFSEHAFSDLNTPYIWLCVYPENMRGQRCYRAASYSDFGVSAIERDRHCQVAESAAAGELILMRRFQV